MFCEHPICSSEANTICKSHCHLSVCQKHRLEHESNLFNTIEKQLNDLSYPVSTLLSQTRYDIQQSEESRQHELTRINSLFNHHISSIDQRLQFSKEINELLIIKRQQLIQHKTGDNQLTNEDRQQIEMKLNQMKKILHEQCQLNKQINNQNSNIDQWPIDSSFEKNHVSTEIECIVLSDSEDKISNNTNHETSSSSTNNTDRLIEIGKTRESPLTLMRDFCPLTQTGVFGLNSPNDITRLCSKTRNKRRYLYMHFIQTHRIEKSIAYQLVKAIRNKSNPMETKIFPQNPNISIDIEGIQCPFDHTASKFNKENSIPNTPCCLLIASDDFENHLQNVHSITKLNRELIYNAMKDYGTISHVQFEEDLCELE